MKNLLLLGGSRYLIPVIKKAKELGIYTITCDYLPQNAAHTYSDEYWNISILEKEILLSRAKLEKIDGVISFACDPGVTTAAYIANSLGLPAAAPYESVCLLQDKGKFRDFLAKNNFNVPKARSYSDVLEASKDRQFFKLPVIVKPVDSAGSKGVSKVCDFDNLNAAVENAIKFSKSHRFIIEEFIEPKGCPSDSDSFCLNGKLEVVSFSSQYFDSKAKNPYTPAAFCWPTTFDSSNREVLRSELQRLMTLLDVNTSIFNIETRVGVDGNPYIMECSPRGGGNRLAEMFKYVSGVDLIDMTVKTAVGLPATLTVQNNDKKFIAEIILHSEKDGLFEALDISETLKDNILETDLWITPGDEVKAFTGANETIGTLVLEFKNELSMRNAISNIDKLVQVHVTEVR